MADGAPDVQPRNRINPEGGEGVKYNLEKNIRLKPGTYKIFLGLTEEKFQKEVTIILSEGTMNVLEFRPEYRYHRITGKTFYEGISTFEVFLNGAVKRD